MTDGYKNNMYIMKCIPKPFADSPGPVSFLVHMAKIESYFIKKDSSCSVTGYFRYQQPQMESRKTYLKSWKLAQRFLISDCISGISSSRSRVPVSCRF